MAARTTLAKLALTGLVIGSVEIDSSAAHAAPARTTSSTSTAAPPRNPSDGQLQQARARAAAAAQRLRQLQGQLTRVRADLAASSASLDIAISAYQRTTDDLRAAVATAAAARTTQRQADQAAALARLRTGRILRITFATAGRNDTALLLGTTDPARLLAAGDISAQLARRRTLALAGLDRTRVAASNAEAATRLALRKQQRLTDRARTERDSVLGAVRRFRSAQSSLQLRQKTLDQQAALAYGQLTGLRSQRAAFDAWRAAEARRLAAQQAAQRAAQQAAQEAARRRAEDQRRRDQQAGGSGSSGSGSSGPTQQPPPVTAPVTQTGWTRPMRAGTYEISSCYCERWGAFHQGVDLAAPAGTPIYAAGPGTVVAAGPASGFGNWVVIDHYDGTFSIYGHMRYLNASVGQRTRGGELIAWVGSEGQSTGPHLHFEVRLGGPDGNPTDPTVWLARRGVDI